MLLKLTAALSLVATSTFAQTATDTELARAARNPYDLARYIDSHTKIDWPVLWKVWRVADPPTIMPRCEPEWHCSVELISVSKPSQVILDIQGAPSDVFLRFVQVGSTWRFAGAHETYRKNFEPRHEMVRIGEKPFLRVSSQGANGSDVDSEYEAWLDLSQPDFKPIFGFTVQGDENRQGFGVSRRLHASATPGLEDSTQTVEVDLEVRFTMYNERNLGLAKYKATYQRASGQKRFTLREAHPFLEHGPAISNKDYELLADINGGDDGISNELLLEFALPGLKEIATGSNIEEREWLKFMLGHCKDTPAKRTLQTLLDGKR